MRQWLRTTLLAAVAALPFSALANEPQEHDGGLFLRLSLGLGSAQTKTTSDSDDFTFKGISGESDLAIGYGFGKNLAFHLSLWNWVLIDPKFEVNGDEYETSDLAVRCFSVGPGVTYYLGDSNVYLTGAVGLAQLTAESYDITAETDSGLGFQVGAGKEW